MRDLIKKYLKKILPEWLKNKIVNLLIVKRALTPIAERECNICGYIGFFWGYGRPMRLDSRCPSCGARERHRLLMLAISRREIKYFSDPAVKILHFAAERCLETKFRHMFKNYATADLFAEADLPLNIESIDIANDQYDIVIANHVLEHVDDRKASRELSRIIKKGGIFVCQVPIIEGWSSTYEFEGVNSDSDRWLHFGQGDHIRYYGADFRERICAGGFKLSGEITSEGSDVIQFGLLRGEKVFIFEKT